MHPRRVLLLATVCHLFISLLPCALWPWQLPVREAWLAKAPVVVCLAMVLGLALWCEALATHGRDDHRATPGGASLRAAQLSGLTVLLLTWLGLIEFGARTRPVYWVATVCGVIVAAVGIGLRSSAILSLGEDFQSVNTLASAGRLKTTGLYAWVRHPSESGLLLFAVGVAFVLHSWLALVFVLLLLLPLVIVRLRAEEVVLRQVCGPAHEQYCRNTPLLVPRLFRIGRFGR